LWASFITHPAVGGTAFSAMLHMALAAPHALYWDAI
jgi:hypothetical protein